MKRRSKYIEYPNQAVEITSLPMVGQTPSATNLEEFIDELFYAESFTNNMISSLGFNTSDGVLTITMNDTPSTTITTDLDGRYALTSHNHIASDITDFSEAVDDRVNTLIQDSATISWSYDDGANTLTASAINPVNVGSDNQIPIVNSGGDNFEYTSDFTFIQDADNPTLAIRGASAAGSSSILFGTDDSTSAASIGMAGSSSRALTIANLYGNTVIRGGNSGGATGTITIAGAANGNISITPNGTGNVLLGNFPFNADQTVGAGQDDYVLRYDYLSGLISLEALASTSINFGTDNQIPVMNSGGTDFEYTANFTYESNVRLVAKGAGANSVAIGPSSIASQASTIAIGNGAEAEGTGNISIGDDAGDTSGTVNTYNITVGAFANQGSSNIGGFSLAMGYQADSTHTGSMAFGRGVIAGEQGAIIMGYHTLGQTNTLTDSFKLMWDGTTGFHVGLTLGTQITTNADPDTNLTAVANGVLAYDTTDHQVRAYINSAWYKLSTLANLQDSGANVVESSTGTGYFEWDQVRLNGQTLSIYQPSGGGTPFYIQQPDASTTNIFAPLDLNIQVGSPISTTSDFKLVMSDGTTTTEDKIHINHNTTEIKNDNIILVDTPPNASSINQVLVRNSSTGAIEYVSIADIQGASGAFINNGGNTNSEYRTFIKMIQIGAWNMNRSSGGSASVTVSHGLSPYGLDSIRRVTASIKEDDSAIYHFDFNYQNGGNIRWTSSNVILEIDASSYFDDVNFDSTTAPANRGWIAVEYETTT